MSSILRQAIRQGAIRGRSVGGLTRGLGGTATRRLNRALPRTTSPVASSSVNQAVSSSSSPINQAIAQDTGSLGFRSMLIGAGIGGGASYLTGGSFMQGAILGGGFGGLTSMGYRNGGQRISDSISGRGMNNAWVGGFGANAATVGGRRVALYAGSGLGGMMFGGRRNKRRGFNANRGSHI